MSGLHHVIGSSKRIMVLFLSILIILLTQFFILPKPASSGAWLTIDSSDLNSHCGDSNGRNLTEALDGTDGWMHDQNHVHYFVLDLGTSYKVTKFRSRSSNGRDPTDVDVYVEPTNGPWVTPVASNITTWQDTSSWVEVDSTDKVGRYVRVEIQSTEHGSNNIGYGAASPYNIFDVYVESRFDQDSFRGRNDNGNETSATWKAAADANWTQKVDEIFRVRFVVQETDGVTADNKTFQLEYNRNGGGWNDVNASSSVVRSAASPNVADGADTTQQIGSGTFVTPNAGFDEANGQAGGTSLDFGGSDEVELEFSLQVRSADVSNNDTIQLRIKGLDTYTNTPSLMVNGILEFDQDSFRGRNDDGNESAATWKVAANSDWTQQMDTNFRVRFVIQETGNGAADDKTFQLEYNHNGGGWNDVTGASSVVRATASPNLADGADSTQQIGSGTFITPNAGFDEVNGLAGGTSLDFGGNDEVEVEYCVQVRSADVSDSDTIQLRVKGLDTYTNTPTITATSSTPPSFDQDSFRGRNDDGNGSGATWLAAADTNWTQAVDYNFRVRFVIQETMGSAAADKAFQLEYMLNSDSWNDVTGASSVVRATASPNVADAADTTQQIGSGTFITPNAGFDEANGQAGGTSLDFSGSDEVEVEYCVRIRSADVAHNDNVQLRIKGLNSYTNTPSITVKETGVGGGRDVAIYRDATDTTNYNSTSATDVIWDTTVREDTLTYSRSGDTVTLKQAGHYLVNWTLSGDQSGTNRTKLEGLLNLGGTPLAYGRGWGYLRDSSTSTESYAQGSAIINAASANTELKLQVFRQDTNTASQGWVRRTNLSGISLLKLDDTWSYARYRKASGTQNVDVMETSAVTLALTDTDEQDTGFSRVGGTITLTNSGHYLVTYNIGIDSTGAAVRQNYVGAVFVEGTEVAGTRTTGYIRESNGDLEGGLSFTGIIVADANDDLEIRIWGDANDGSPTATVDLVTTAVALVKLPDDADYIRLHGSDGTQNLSTTESNISFNTANEEDPSFEYSSGSPDQIKVLTAGDYLFTWSVFARKPSANGTREHIWTKLAKKGTPDTVYQWALAGNYIRGSQGTPAINCPAGGASVGAIIEAAADDIILLKQQNEASDANAVIVADRYAIQGVSIDSLFNSTCRFTKYRSITIQSSKVLADLTNFPVMVELTGAEFQAIEDDVTDAQGDDIIFRESSPDGNQLSHEIEVYDTVNDKLVAWVKVPSVSSSSNTTFYMVYGNACITTSAEDVEGVWSAYEAVYHLHESSGTHYDSTSNGNDSTSETVTQQGADIGKIDGADEFDGSDDAVTLTNEITVGDNYTLEYWMASDDLTQRTVLGKIDTNNYIGLINSTTFRLRTNGGTNLEWSVSSMSTGTLYHVAFTKDNSNNWRCYLNGTESITGAISDTNTFRIKTLGQGYTGNNYAFDGILDEVRVVSTARTSNWIQTEVNNQNSPATFYQLGSETLIATAVTLLSFTASGDGDAVLVEWQTAREWDNVGFHLYRAASPQGPYTRLTDKLISATVKPAKGGSYSYTDSDVTVGTLYYYKLEDIDIYGKHTLHGPICVDWDADGIPDDWEVTRGLDPWVNDADLDYDNDGLSNLEEYERGLDPFNADSDGDGIPDGEEDGRLPGREDPGARAIGPGVEVLSKDETGMTLVLTTGGFEAAVVNVGGAEYEQLKIGDYVHGYTARTGAPQLPLKGLMIDVPAGKAAKLSVIDSEVEPHRGYRVYPVPQAVVDAAGGMAAVGSSFYQDELAYSSDGFYPDAVAALGQRYVFREQLKQQVIFYPIGFNPASGQLNLYRRIELRIDFVDDLFAKASANTPSPWQVPAADPGVLAPIAVGLAAAPALVNPVSPLLSSLGAAITALWSPPEGPAGDVYKIITDTVGIHQIGKGWLDANGVNTANIDLSRMRLYNLGSEVAIEVVDQNNDDRMDAQDFIRFYAAPVSSLYAKYSNQNVYWFTLSGGTGSPLHMGHIEAAPAGGPLAADFADSARHELDQTIWLKAPGADDIERWFFWTYVQGTEHAGGGLPKAFTVTVPDPTSNGTLTILMAGQTDTEHEVKVAINGVEQLFSWSGISYFEATLDDVPLVAGDNTVTLQCLSADGNDSIIVDWFEIDYWRDFVAVDNQLTFAPDSGDRYVIDGFSSNRLLAYDISDPLDIAVISNPVITGTDPYSFEFEPIVYGDTYRVLAADTVHIPVGLIADTAANLANTANGADYILITHRDVGWDGNGDPLPWLEDLTAHREAQGLRVFVADIEDIYDTFSYGIQSPHAVKDFLAWAYANWTPPAAQHVLLVGDATYDPKNHWNEADSTAYLPTYSIYTDHKGETVTDQWFVTFSGEDAVADMHIGRLPAADAAQAQIMIDKIIAYETAANTQTWQSDLLLIADNQRPGAQYRYEAAFETINEDAAALIPAAMADPFRGYLNDYAATAFLTDDIIDSINDGVLIANYAGHGATQVLAEEHIFDAGDVGALTNAERLPFFVSMACEAGFFAYPETWFYPSLAEALLRSQNGAVAAFMPTGMTATEGQQILGAALFEAIFRKDIRTLGPAIADAKQTLLVNGETGYAQVNDTFLLFGDPATALKVPLPHVPTAVRVQRRLEGVHIRWDAVTDCNRNAVAGYNIYRAASAAGPFAKINIGLVTDTVFVDTDGAAGMADGGSSSDSYYAVSAVDSSGFESVQSLAVKPAAAAAEIVPCFISTATQSATPLSWVLWLLLTIMTVLWGWRTVQGLRLKEKDRGLNAEVHASGRKPEVRCSHTEN